VNTHKTTPAPAGVKKRSKKTGKENPEMGEKGPLNEVILVILNTS
jgi:hypothetical protein